MPTSAASLRRPCGEQIRRDVRPQPGSGLTEDALLTLAATAEHPLARAVTAAAARRGLEHLPATPGIGVTATVAALTGLTGTRPVPLTGDHPSPAAT